MARYIDADKFLQDEIKRCGCVPLVGTCTTDNESLAYRLAKAPTADVEEVVRCKDCLWATERIRDNELFSHQCRNTIACGKPRRAIDFCSYGERK